MVPFSQKDRVGESASAEALCERAARSLPEAPIHLASSAGPARRGEEGGSMNPASVTQPKSRSREYFIPVLPALSPSSLRRRQETLPFPFSHPRYYDYYFGRNAVWHGMKQIGLGEGRRVLIPSYHHGVEVEAILQAGCQVDFYRVDLHLQIDLEDLEKKITPETGMIYLIYYLGFPHPIEEIVRLCRTHGLLLVEDCALSLFSEIDGKPMGSFGD
ncbi:MAG: DegT/DnrJ/EryC1/StrS aminotransferase family protein, partial [Candidatus Manganitrophaceae bacterium]